jgi:hypothetical protein
MTAMTYSSLVSDISLYTERTDAPFTAQVPSFIMMAENRLASEIKPLGFLRAVSGNLNGNTLQKPARWRRTKSFAITVSGQRQYVFDRSYEYCRTFAPDASVTDVPRYYADYDYEHFFIAPTPDIQYPFELLYYERPMPLSDSNQTNWTTQYAPQLLLYASLIEAMPFLKTDERMAGFQAMYDRAAQAITKEDQERSIDASA